MRINVTTKFEHDCETKIECMPACRNLVGSNIITCLRLVYVGMSSMVSILSGSWEWEGFN
jgi:hypothetical protein